MERRWRRVLLPIAAIPAVAWLLPGASPVAQAPSASENRSADSAVVATGLQMENVDFYIDPQIPLRIRRLAGTMKSKTAGPVVFDDKQSFVIQVDAGEVGLTGEDLSLL
ncbi:MAG TPA: hypothetical protein VHM24_10190, partial [Gemmatimonadaceae bacterium]|nr:hypothetical protein [Gemmatimonadaceae bacterium]